MMESVDFDVLKFSVCWFEEGCCVLFVMVVKMWGLLLCFEGVMFVVCEDGLVVGFVFGGCIEDDLIVCVYVSGIVVDVCLEVFKYGVIVEEVYCFGLFCGGMI